MSVDGILISALTADEAKEHLDQFIELLQDSVRGGASIGFIQVPTCEECRAYWEEVFQEIALKRRVLLVAQKSDNVIGSVQLELAMKPNAHHRAEVQKLMVLQSARHQKVGQRLMYAIEQQALTSNRSLLVLDTQQGSAAESLYRGLQYQKAGVIPQYAWGPNGVLHATVLFSKQVG